MEQRLPSQTCATFQKKISQLLHEMFHGIFLTFDQNFRSGDYHIFWRHDILCEIWQRGPD